MESGNINTKAHQIVIVGGGTAGITVAALLSRKLRGRADIAIIDPSKDHFYQPAWTLVGGGTYRKEATRRDMANLIPRGVAWIKDAVSSIDPQENSLQLASGDIIQYRHLVVAAGIKINWDKVPGLAETIGTEGVCSNYSFETVDSTWDNIRNFKGGTAIFTHPATPIKCGGAPQKIMYLADETFRKNGVREKTRIIFAIANPDLFQVPVYRQVLEQVVARKGIETMFLHDLKRLNPGSREAVFRQVETGDETTVKYDMIHVTPPMGPPDFIANSDLADQAGWVEVDKFTLQHSRFANVYGLGDCSNLPTSKTGAAIRKQAPVVVKNLLSAIKQQPAAAKYDGYTSCPLVTGYGKLVMAEFDYDKKPQESFPINQAKERYSMWLVKKYGLPFLYWNIMLKGRG